MVPSPFYKRHIIETSKCKCGSQAFRELEAQQSFGDKRHNGQKKLKNYTKIWTQIE